MLIYSIIDVPNKKEHKRIGEDTNSDLEEADDSRRENKNCSLS